MHTKADFDFPEDESGFFSNVLFCQQFSFGGNEAFMADLQSASDMFI